MYINAYIIHDNTIMTVTIYFSWNFFVQLVKLLEITHK